MWLMYHWLCGSRKSPPIPPSAALSTPFSTKHARMQVHTAEEREGWEVAEGGREGAEGGGVGRWRVGGVCRFMIIPKQMLLLKTLWIANRAACQESRNQNTSLWGEVDERREGVRWGSCFPAFVSTPAVRPFFLTLFFTHSGVGGLVLLKVRLKSFTLFEVSVRDTGSSHRKKLIRLCPIPSLTLFVSQPLKCFVLFCYANYILSMNKSHKKTTTLHS